MHSLAKRHEDRAKRKAVNALSSETYVGNSLAHVESLARQTKEAMAKLSDEEKDEVMAALEAGEAGSSRSLAEDETGNHTMAGIGVVNSAVVPAAVLANEDSGEGSPGASAAAVAKDAGWGATPPPTVETPEPAAPIDGNISGHSLGEQAAGASAKGAKSK